MVFLLDHSYAEKTKEPAEARTRTIDPFVSSLVDFIQPYTQENSGEYKPAERGRSTPKYGGRGPLGQDSHLV